MSHARAQVRLAVVAALAGLATTGTNVFPGRLRPLGKNPPPSLFVYSLEEEAAIDAAGAPPRQVRPLTLAVEGRVQLAGGYEEVDPEDTLDDIACEVETALFAAFAVPAGRLRALLLALDYAGMRMDLQPAGEVVAGTVTMRFIATYRTAEGAPATAL